MAEVKGTAKFSLPFREGMEGKKYYVETKTVETESKTYPGEKVFAYFACPFTSTTEAIIAEMKTTQEKMLVAGCCTKKQNAFRLAVMGDYGKEFGIEVAGGGVGKQDTKLITGMVALVGKDFAKVAKGFAAATGKTLTKEDFEEATK